MQDFVDIEEWKKPTWHSDFGDPTDEFVMLVEFCKKLRLLGMYSFKLDCFEEGYMKVDLYKYKKKIGELYINNDEITDKYCLFLDYLDNEEHYFSSAKDGVDYIRQNL